MVARIELQNLKNVLKKYGQTHLLAFLDRLDPARQENLLAQISQNDSDLAAVIGVDRPRGVQHREAVF